MLYFVVPTTRGDHTTKAAVTDEATDEEEAAIGE